MSSMIVFSRRSAYWSLAAAVAAPRVREQVGAASVCGSCASGALDALDFLLEVPNVHAMALAVTSSHGAQDGVVIAVPSRSWDSRGRESRRDSCCGSP